MQWVATGVATFAVASIYCAWRNYIVGLIRRERQLRARVAFMLWKAARAAD